jgi:hypothetical protein
MVKHKCGARFVFHQDNAPKQIHHMPDTLKAWGMPKPLKKMGATKYFHVMMWHQK